MDIIEDRIAAIDIDLWVAHPIKLDFDEVLVSVGIDRYNNFDHYEMWNIYNCNEIVINEQLLDYLDFHTELLYFQRLQELTPLLMQYNLTYSSRLSSSSSTAQLEYTMDHESFVQLLHTINTDSADKLHDFIINYWSLQKKYMQYEILFADYYGQPISRHYDDVIVALREYRKYLATGCQCKDNLIFLDKVERAITAAIVMLKSLHFTHFDVCERHTFANRQSRASSSDND